MMGKLGLLFTENWQEFGTSNWGKRFLLVLIWVLALLPIGGACWLLYLMVMQIEGLWLLLVGIGGFIWLMSFIASKEKEIHKLRVENSILELRLKELQDRGNKASK